MPVNTGSWADGTPAWVDLMSPDVERSAGFYGELFGWQLEEGSAELGGYRTARVDGYAVAGLGPVQGPGQDQPVAWTTYLAAADATATLSRVTEAGGQVVVPTLPIGELGAMAVAADPTGAVFGLWQAGRHTGIEVWGRPGTVVWSEGLVGDLDAARTFYGSVFGYSFAPVPGGMAYETIELGGRPVGGIGSVEIAGPAVAPHWRTYFQVEDVPRTCRRVSDLGGRVLAEPWHSPFGRMASVAGPHGEVFLVNTPAAG